MVLLVGNATIGIFALGQTTSHTLLTTRDKYTYSGDVVTSGTAATLASMRGSASGNSVESIFVLGYGNTGINDGTTNIVDKYTYSGDIVTSGTSLGFVELGTAAGNSVEGIFALGFNGSYELTTAARVKYTYAGDIVGAATGSSLPGFWRFCNIEWHIRCYIVIYWCCSRIIFNFSRACGLQKLILAP